MDSELLRKYNYDAFIPDNFDPWTRFDESPLLGSRVDDYPLWTLERAQTSLLTEIKKHRFTVVEFGSFT